MRQNTSLLDRIAVLRKKHGPVGNSSFSGIVGNLSMVLSIFSPDHPDYRRTEIHLEAYTCLVESGSEDFIEAEMRHPRGYFPESFPLGHPEPHHAYIATVYKLLTGQELR